MSPPSRPCFLAATLVLAACGADENAPLQPDRDPALEAALSDQIMIDPDLVGQNRANSAAAMPSNDGFLPSIDRTSDAIAAARAEALRIVGGPGRMRKAREPREVKGELADAPALTAAARAAVSPGVSADCAARADYTMRWAARLPAAFPVYPRAAVQEAAGTDAAGCALRVVNFVTPVALGEVMDFYYTRAGAAGFSTERLLRDGDDVLAGTKGGQSFVIYARRLATGNTKVDLVTGG